MPQYSKPLTLHRGVDNQIQFQFLNQEQKKVDITGQSWMVAPPRDVRQLGHWKQQGHPYIGSSGGCNSARG